MMAYSIYALVSRERPHAKNKNDSFFDSFKHWFTLHAQGDHQTTVLSIKLNSELNTTKYSQGMIPQKWLTFVDVYLKKFHHPKLRWIDDGQLLHYF